MASQFFSCKPCGQKFDTVHELILHYEVHQNEAFSNVEHGDTDIKTHKDEMLVSCNQCDEKFSNSQDLIQHLQLHTAEKPFQCELCDQSFAQSSDLKRHNRSHAKNKRFECPYCGKKFATSYYVRTKHLQLHMRDNFTSTGKWKKSTRYAAPAAPYIVPAETRNEDVVRGSYFLQESDRTRPTINYTTDSVNGYNNVVDKEPTTDSVKTVAAPIVSTPDVAKYAAPAGYTSYAAPDVERYATPAETRNEDVVKDSYSLQEFDRTHPTINYTADSVNGYNADVDEEPTTDSDKTVTAPIVSTPDVAKYAAPAGYTSYAAPDVERYGTPVAYTSYAAPNAYAHSAAYTAPANYATYAARTQSYIAQAQTYAAPAYTYAAPAGISGYSAPVVYNGYGSSYNHEYYY